MTATQPFLQASRLMQHCLVIEDSSIIRRVSRSIFESLVYRVSEAQTAAETLEYIALDAPDLILIDWIIPGTNVRDLITAIRRAKTAKRPFILYLTTENDEADLKAAFRAGADDYLLKPFNREIIEMKLTEIRVAA